MPIAVPDPLGAPSLADWTRVLAGLTADEIEVEVPAQPSAAGRTLLASMHAARQVSGLPIRLCGADAPAVLALAPVEDLRAARRIADRLADDLEQGMPRAAASVLRAVRFAAEELGANIVQHSGAPRTGFVAASVDRAGERLQLAASDAGKGFLASLVAHPELSGRVADDGEAIQLAVGKGVSGIGGRTNMGMGLGVLSDLSDRLGADLWIASGLALWQRRTVTGGVRAATVRQLPVPLPGAWVCFEGPGRPPGLAGLAET